MLLSSILFGACLYLLVQLLWYSPVLFGPKYLKLSGQSEMHVLTAPGVQGREQVLLATVLPAFLLSFAIHAMRALFAWLPGPYFLLACLLSGIIPVLPKYFATPRPSIPLALLQDGALVVSVFGIGCIALIV